MYPDDMNAAGEDAEEIGVVEREHDEFVVRQNRSIEENEEAMLHRLNRGDVAAKPVQRRAEVAARLAENPPVITVARAVVLIALGFHAVEYPLIYFGESLANFFRG